MPALRGLSLSLLEYEASGSKPGDYLSLLAAAGVGAFAGATELLVRRRDLAAYLAELDTLDQTLNGEVAFRCGGVLDEQFQLVLAPHGHGGRLRARAELAARIGEGEVHSTRISFVLLPNALTAFRRQLRTLLEGEMKREAVLEAEV